MKTQPCKDCGTPVEIKDTTKLDSGIKIKIRCPLHKRGSKPEGKKINGKRK